MQQANAPSQVGTVFAEAGTKNTIPETPSATPGLASFQLGFPPVTMTPLVAGGIPPEGADFNGILNFLSQCVQWNQVGGSYNFDSDFSTAIGGYPKGAIVQSVDGTTEWLCLADNNTTDPDSSSAANWAALASYGIAAITGLTNANVTLTPAQYGKPIITLAGTLTGNVQIVLPTSKRQWTIINNCTGAFTVTVKTASGSGVIIAGSGGIQLVYGDGTNIISSGVLTQSVADARYAALAGSSSQVFSVAAAAAAANAVRYDQTLGLGQTWKEVTASRAIGTTYTNSSAKPIVFSVSVQHTTSENLALTVNGVSISTISTGTTNIVSSSAIVPPGATYSAVVSAGTLYRWSELSA